MAFLHFLTKLYSFFIFFVTLSNDHAKHFFCSTHFFLLFFKKLHTKVCRVTHKHTHSLIVQLDIPPYLEDDPYALKFLLTVSPA